MQVQRRKEKREDPYLDAENPDDKENNIGIWQKRNISGRNACQLHTPFPWIQDWSNPFL